MDTTEPPRIVFEAPAQCRDGDEAGKALRNSLTTARAPGAGWTLTLKIEGSGPRLRASGELTDREGTRVGHRELAETTNDCQGLARAMGVWAGLVLDAEVQRASALTSEPVPSIAAAAGDSGVVSGWPPPAVLEPASPEHDWYLHHDEGRSVEVGAGVFLMSGSGGGALAGPVAFVMVEAGHGIYWRPSVAFGQTLSSIPPSDVKSATWGAGRVDACLRLPGLYSQHHGMQLDVCAGTDVGITHVDSTANSGIDLPYWAIGPSVELRGELGGRLSAVLRTAVGIDVVRGTYVDNSGATEQQPLATARLELAFSWDTTDARPTRTADVIPFIPEPDRRTSQADSGSSPEPEDRPPTVLAEDVPPRAVPPDPPAQPPPPSSPAPTASPSSSPSRKPVKKAAATTSPGSRPGDGPSSGRPLAERDQLERELRVPRR